MGPRSIDRGIARSTRLITICMAVLQWGRDQLIAELKQRIAELVGELTLQWGRDQLIAELKQRIPELVGELTLQWGRDQLIAELQDHLSAEPPYLPASMGPRSIDRGIETSKPAISGSSSL